MFGTTLSAATLSAARTAAKHAARAGIAAFLLGISFTAAPPIALAEETETGTGTAAAERSPSAPVSPTRASRAATRPTRVATAPRSSSPSPAAAGIPVAKSDPAGIGEPQIPAATTRKVPRRDQRPRTQTVIDAAPTRIPDGAADVGPSQTPVPVAPRVVATPSAARTVTAAQLAAGAVTVQVPKAIPTPGALAGVSAAAGTAAVTSVFDVLNGLLAPIREVFEGIALLVRRTFFNQAPSLSPVQLTGQSEGPITGTLGAVDPEGDPLVYSITQNARYGSAVINADGSYTYTPGPDFAGTDSFIASATDTGFHINLFDLFRPESTATNVGLTQGSSASMVTFQFVYGTGAQHWSSEARSALDYVAATLSASLVVASPVTLTYSVTGEFAPFSSTLASAGSDLVSADAGFLRTVVQDKILSGTDANGAAADGEISWNFGPGWALGGAVTGSQYDFQSTAMHELLHTLGFLSNVGPAGSNTGESWTVFDSFMVTSAGTAVIGGDYLWNTVYNPNLTGGGGGLYFGGANAVTAYGGLVPLFTPSPWQSGSSLSHLDDDTFTGADEQLMNAESNRGPGIRVVSPLEAAILADLGYTVVPGPGVAAWAFIGLVLIRRPRRRD